MTTSSNRGDPPWFACVSMSMLWIQSQRCSTAGVYVAVSFNAIVTLAVGVRGEYQPAVVIIIACHMATCDY